MLNWNLITPRAEELWRRNFEWNLQSRAGTAPPTVNGLDFATVKPIRLTFIILACINAAAGFATAAGIFWESYTTARKNGQGWGFRSFRTNASATASLFPFILSCGILVQGTIFAAAQSRGLESLSIEHCSLTTQFMLLALFIPPFIHFIFGLEIAIRALHRYAFSVKGRWNTVICLCAVGLLLLMTVSSVLLIQPSEACFASLMWYLESYKLGCLGLLAAITTILIIAGVVIFFRLRKTSRVDIKERIEASHMVYYLAANCFLNFLMLPFFLHISIMNSDASDTQARDLSTVAGIVVNLSGFITAALYLFLRSRRTTIIGLKRKEGIDAEGAKLKNRPWTPSETHFSKQIARPISPPKSIHRKKGAAIGHSLKESVDEKSWMELHDQSPKPRFSVYFGFRSARTSQQTSNNVDVSRESRYSLPRALPTKARNEKSLPIDQRSLLQAEQQNYAAVYTSLVQTMTQEVPPKEQLLPPTDHLLPPRIYAGHHRMSSTISSATVQIGLRLSNPNDMQLHNSDYMRNSGENHLGCPNQMQANASRKRSPLAPLNTDIPTANQSRVQSLRRSRTASPAAGLASPGAGITLTPAVYSPNRAPPRVMSPLGLTSPVRPYRMRERTSPVPLHDGPEIKHEDWI